MRAAEGRGKSRDKEMRTGSTRHASSANPNRTTDGPSHMSMPHTCTHRASITRMFTCTGHRPSSILNYRLCFSPPPPPFPPLYNVEGWDCTAVNSFLFFNPSRGVCTNIVLGGEGGGITIEEKKCVVSLEAGWGRHAWEQGHHLLVGGLYND